MKKVFKLIIVLICCASLSGCFEKMDVDSQCYPIGLGVDKGRIKQFAYTLVIPTIGKAGGEDSSGSNGKMMSETIEADSMSEAEDLFNQSLPWKVNFYHTDYLVVSEVIAKSSMKEVLNTLPQRCKLSQINYIYVSKGKAKSFFDGLLSSIDTNMTKTQQTFELESKLSGLLPYTTLVDFVAADATGAYDTAAALCSENILMKDDEEKKSEKESSGTQSQDKQSSSEEEFNLDKYLDELEEKGEPLPEGVGGDSDGNSSYIAGESIRQGGLKSEVMGSAIFADGKMVGEIDGTDTQIMLIGQGKFFKGTVEIKSNDGTLIIELMQRSKPTSSLDLDAKKVIVEVYIDATVLNNLEQYNQYWRFEEKQDTDNVIKTVTSYLIEKLDEVEKYSKELNSDIFAIGKNVMKKFKTNREWEEYKWKEKYKDFSIEWKVLLKLKPIDKEQHI